MAHLTFVAISPALSENLRAHPRSVRDAVSAFGPVGRASRDSGPRFPDRPEEEKTSTDAGMTVRRNEKKMDFGMLVAGQVVSPARGLLVT